MKELVDYLFLTIFAPLLYVYERWFMYRIRNAWGFVHLYNIKNKGRNVKVVGYSRYLCPNNLIIGNDVRIGYGCFLYCKGGIQIGDGTVLSRNITIYSSNHNYNGDAIPYDDTETYKPVIIGKGVWVGMGVMIIPGIRIGDGAIIGMGAVVSRNVSAGEVVVGAAQKVVSMRDMKKFRKHLADDKLFSTI